MAERGLNADRCLRAPRNGGEGRQRENIAAEMMILPFVNFPLSGIPAGDMSAAPISAAPAADAAGLAVSRPAVCSSLSVLCLSLALVFFFTGCASLFTVDTSRDRQTSLAGDLAFLKPRQTMQFDAPLTLKDAIRIGMENNLDLRVSGIMALIADDTAFAARLKMLPGLTGEARLGDRSDFLTRKYVDPETGEASDPSESSSSFSNQDKRTETFSLTLSWNILDLGLSYFRARKAGMEAEARRRETMRQAQLLAMDIASAFRKAVIASRDLAYVDEIEGAAREYQQRVEDLVAERRLDAIAAREMENQLLRLTMSAASLHAEVAAMKMELARLMGLTPATRFDLADDGEFDAGIDALPDPRFIDPEALERLSLERRPELYAADLKSRVRQDEVRSAFISLFPSLNLAGAWHYDADRFLVKNDWTTLSMGLVYQLLSFPSRFMEYRAAKKGIDVARLERILLTAGIITQVHVALLDYRIRLEQYELQARAYGIARDLFEMSRERNEAGMAGFTDLLVTRRMLESMLARLERDRSLAVLHDTRVSLLVTLGLGPDEWEMDLTEAESHLREQAEPLRKKEAEREAKQAECGKTV